MFEFDLWLYEEVIQRDVLVMVLLLFVVEPI